MEQEGKPFNDESYSTERLLLIQKYKTDLLGRLGESDISLNADELDQHFTVDPILISKLAENLGPENTVVDIGAGIGNITNVVAESGAHIYAVEIDERFRAILEEDLGSSDNVELISGNILNFEIPREVDTIVGNPPFSVLEPIFKKIYDSNVERINIIVGQNTLRALDASLSDDDFSIMSLYAQSSFRVLNKEKLESKSFYPEPTGQFFRVELVKKQYSQEKEDFLSVQQDRLLEQFARQMIENPNLSLELVLRDVVENNRAFNKKVKKYKDYSQLISVKNFDIRDDLLKKSIGTLNNHEVRTVLQSIMGKINRKFKTSVEEVSKVDEETNKNREMLVKVRGAIEEMAAWSGGEYFELVDRFLAALNESNELDLSVVAQDALDIAQQELSDEENSGSSKEIIDWIKTFEDYINEAK